MVKKVTAIFLSAMLFCLASGTAFASYTWDSLKRTITSPLVDNTTGEIGPLIISNLSGNELKLIQDYVAADGEGFIVTGYTDINPNNSYHISYLQICRILPNTKNFDSDTLLFNSGSWYIDNKRLISKTNTLVESIQFMLSDNDRWGYGLGNSYNYTDWANYSQSVFGSVILLSYKPLKNIGISFSTAQNIWIPAVSNPDCLKLTFDIDVPPLVQSHNLTINYTYSNGQEAAPAYSADLQEGESYDILSPAVDGYAPDRSTVAGTMGTEDVVETVTYNLDPPPVQSHNLTINYIHQNGQEAAPAYSADLQEGESYSIPSPAVEGYAPDRLTVSGTMGTEDILETVIYNPDSPEVDPPDPGTAGTVTIHYLYADGGTAAPTKTQTLGVGQMFQIPSPDVPGYTPSRKIIFGYTGSKELVFDVTYTQQAAASAGGIFFAPPDKPDGINWNPGGTGGIPWNPNNSGGITFQPKQSGGIVFLPPKSIGSYPFDIPRRWSLWN